MTKTNTFDVSCTIFGVCDIIRKEVRKIEEKKNEKKKEKASEGFIRISKSTLKDKPDKSRKLLVTAYLKIYSSISGHINISINHLIKRIGYAPDRHKGRINSKIIELLKDFEKYSCIYILDNLDKISHNDCFTIQIEEQSELFNPQKDFVILTQSEFNTIVTSKSTCDKQDMLNVYLNIKKFINFGSDSFRSCYPSHTTLCRDCHIKSTGAMNNIIDALVNDKLLYKYNAGGYKDKNGRFKFVNNIYALEDGILKPETCDETIKAYYSSQGITIENFIKQ